MVSKLGQIPQRCSTNSHLQAFVQYFLRKIASAAVNRDTSHHKTVACWEVDSSDARRAHWATFTKARCLTNEQDGYYHDITEYRTENGAHVTKERESRTF